jgi:signal transduction histidine kinase/ActR/RegA family two-component response regulator
MKVQTKIALLLTMLGLVFGGALVGFAAFQRRNIDSLREKRQESLVRSFSSLLDSRRSNIDLLVDYYAVSNLTVAAIEDDDRSQLKAELDDLTLERYESQAVWVYDARGTLFFSHHTLYGDVSLPIERLIPVLDANAPFTFFIQTEPGLLEITGSTVRRASEPANAERAGYLFAGRLWDQTAIKDLSTISNKRLELVASPTDAAPAPLGSARATWPLRGWNGDPVAYLVATQVDDLTQQFVQFSSQSLAALVGFAIVVVVMLSVFLVRWVGDPLRNISVSLKTENLRPIQALLNDRSEFGTFARLIQQFFVQREKLIDEIDERRHTEAALRDSEQRLVHSQKMEAIGRLAGGIAHDFNNLLTAILGYADLLRDRLEHDPAGRQSAELIRKAGEQAAALTRQLLAFSRKQILQPRVFDLHVMVTEMHKLLERVIGEHIRLERALGAGRSRIRADPGQIEQVIMNLCVNARDAMPRGGTLRITTENCKVTSLGELGDGSEGSLTPGDYVVLAVADTGVGMDDATAARIFDPFFTTKGPGKGTGLGLATVYGIVQQTGGTIRVETAPDFGTVFRVYLPVENAPVDPIPEAPVRLAPSRHNETVVVVEDDPIVREFVCTVLSERGYEVLCAPTGAEAIEMISRRSGPIDLVVTDVVMPVMSGQDLVRRLATLLPNTKVLYVSGYSDNEISDQGVLDPRIELLQKPFSPEELLRKVQEVLSSPRVARIPELAVSSTES